MKRPAPATEIDLNFHRTITDWEQFKQHWGGQHNFLKGMAKPAAVTVADIYNIVQPPGSVLWNAHTTPHWVETFDECALTLTLVHDGLRLNGRLCPHAEAMVRWRTEHGLNRPEPQNAVRPY